MLLILGLKDKSIRIHLNVSMSYAFEKSFGKIKVLFFAKGELSIIDIVYYFWSSIQHQIELESLITQKSHKIT